MCLSSTQWHAVAVDECHKICVNKDTKMAMVCPSKERMTFLSTYLQFRAKCVQTIFYQILKPKQETFSHAVTYKDKKCEANITKVLNTIARHGLFHDSNFVYIRSSPQKEECADIHSNRDSKAKD